MFSQLLGCKIAHVWRSLITTVFVVVLTSGIAWSADTNKLMAVSVDSSNMRPAVLIETAEPVGYRYTVYDSFEPTRVVIDFPGMQLADIDEMLAVNQGSVEEIRIAGFNLSSGQLARVEILLSETSDYQVTLDGNKFSVTFDTEVQNQDATTKTAPAPAPIVKADPGKMASVLNKVELSSGKATLMADGKIDKFQHFVLSAPPRLVIDVYGVKPAFKERSFAIDTGFKKVRIGTYNDKTRFVFDANSGVLPEHLVDGRETDIVVTWGGTQRDQEVATAQIETKAEESPIKEVSVVEAKQNVAEESSAVATGPVAIEAIDFLNEGGVSVINVALSSPSIVAQPVMDGNLIRFEIENANISRALRRTIDASAFPSAVTTVTPYTVTEGDQQNVRVAVDVKGPVGYALEQDGAIVKLVIEDGAYAEAAPPEVSQVEVLMTSDMSPTEMTTPISRGSMSNGNAESLAHDVPTTDGRFYKPGQEIDDDSVINITRAEKEIVTAQEMEAEATEESPYTGEKITLVFDDASVRSILQLIGDVSGLNIVASADVKGKITLRLIDVPWDQAFELVLETADLGRIQQGNVLVIMPKQKMRDLHAEELKEKNLALEEGVVISKVFTVSHTSVEDAVVYLNALKSKQGQIISDTRNKQIIIREVEGVMEEMGELIKQIDKPEKQVLIEARIVEATTTFSRNLGVKWVFDYSQPDDKSTRSLEVQSAGVGLGGSFVVSPSVGGPGIGTSLMVGALDDALNIDLRLSALESSNEGRIISSPRIITLNGEEAKISQGTRIPFSTINEGTPSVQFEDAELKLAVTPEINPDGSILLEIDASNSSIGSIVPTATGDAVSIQSKTAETKILIKDGQTTVLGGIYVEQETEAVSGVPVLKDIPVLGGLFRSTTTSKDRRELLIFITPRIVKP